MAYKFPSDEWVKGRMGQSRAGITEQQRFLSTISQGLGR